MIRAARLPVAFLASFVVFPGCTPEPKPITGPIEGNSFAIANARVFDGAETLDGATVIVHDRLFESVGVKMKAPPGLPLVDGIGLSLANYDDNQHTDNENLRLGNLWEGIASLAAIMTHE